MSSFMPRIWSLACGAAILPAVHAERPPWKDEDEERRREKKKSSTSLSAHVLPISRKLSRSPGHRSAPALSAGRTCAAAALGRAGCRIHWVRGRSSRLVLFGRRWERMRGGPLTTFVRCAGYDVVSALIAWLSLADRVLSLYKGQSTTERGKWIAFYSKHLLWQMCSMQV
jgi:hypothetical protein